jgi:hypothetical protein
VQLKYHYIITSAIEATVATTAIIIVVTPSSYSSLGGCSGLDNYSGLGGCSGFGNYSGLGGYSGYSLYSRGDYIRKF